MERSGLLKLISSGTYLGNKKMLKDLPKEVRTSMLYVLNQKTIARKAALDLEKKYKKINVIVTHLVVGISVGIHCKGKAVDINNSLN